MAEIGVIVPVYNGERYLRRCIESILSQTFQDFELILIDDGSTDASGRICDEYAAENEKVRVVHTENRGVSAARNQGIETNGSAYVVFVDSDDYIAPKYLQTLYQMMQRNRADLVISCGRVVEESGEGAALADEGLGERVISKCEAYRCMLTDKGVITSAWGKLYHREVFQSVRYPEGEIYEDMKVIEKIIENSRRIVYTSYRGYFYVQTTDSITRGNASSGHLTLLKNERELGEFLNRNYPELQGEVKRHYFWSCFFVLGLLADQPLYEKECQEIREEVVVEWRFLLFGAYTGIMEKGAVICLLFGLAFFRFMWGKSRRLVRKRLVDSGREGRDGGYRRDCPGVQRRAVSEKMRGQHPESDVSGF